MRGKRHYGELGEAFAEKYLDSKGYKILKKNFRSGAGEIDIVAQDADTLVFVEVKTRWSSRYGAPEEAVTARKLQKIKKVGEYYSLIHPTLPKKLRIDVVAIEVQEGKVTSCKLIKVS